MDPTAYITRDEKASRARELKTVLATISEENSGVLAPDVQTRWDASEIELAAVEADIAAADARMAKVESFSDKTETPAIPVPMQINRKSEADIFDVEGATRGMNKVERRQTLRDNAMRAAEQMRVPSDRYDQDKSRERVQNLLDYNDSRDGEIASIMLTTGSPQYREAFNNYVASGGQERAAALAVGVDGTGGFAVPVTLDPTILAVGAWTAINPYRQACRVETISGTDTWQALTASVVAASYAAEAAAATEAGPTFVQPEYVAKRAHSFVTVSYEMAQDRPSLPSDLGKLFGEAKDTLEEAQFTTGAGTTVYPQGIGLKDAITRVDSITNDTHAVADVLALEAAVPIRHRMTAAWFLTRAAIRAIQAYETVGGQLYGGIGYPATPSPATNGTGNTGLTLLGYPVWETPTMPWTPTTDDTTWGVLMPPSNYVIVDRVGMSIKVIPDMLDGATPSFPTGQIGVYAFWRNTARVLNVDGGRQGAIQ